MNAAPRHPVAPLERLRAVVGAWPSALVAFSGGVDSALVACVAHEQLGSRMVALTADSATLPREELAIAREVAERFGFEHLVVPVDELAREGYAANRGDRCYHCKSALWETASRIAADRGLAVLADGTVLDDLGEHRPGLRASGEHAVVHPLVEAGMRKGEVREAARALGIPVWDKPAFACLGSRFPVGTRVTPERVRAVARVESVLRTLGFRVFRVRYHLVEGRPLARIEVGPAELSLLAREGIREAVLGAARGAGFRWVTLDLEGYRRGGAAAEGS